MTTLVLKSPGLLVCEKDAALPDPGPGEVRVRVKVVGVCGTDYHAYRGKQPFFSYPRILGHEAAVEVVDVGQGVIAVKAQDRCAVKPYVSCNACIACRSGKPNCCERISVLGVHADGALRAEYLVPAANLHSSAVLSFEELALVEPLGIGAHAVARGNVSASDRVLVIGAGPIGLATLQFAAASGAELAVLDTSSERLRLCREILGVKESALPAASLEENLQLIRSFFGGELPSVVFDASGNAASMATSFLYPCHGGRLVFVGLVTGEISFSDPEFHKRELTVMGSRNAKADDFANIIGLMEQRRIDVGKWVTHRSKIEEAPRVLPEWMEPEARCLKGLIEV